MSVLQNLVERNEPRYVKKIKKMAEICTRSEKENDAVLIIEGREGTGKTNASAVTAGVFKYFAQRQVFLFFDLEKLIWKAQSTTSKIFIWDEPALDALTTDQLNELNKNLVKLLMTCRVNRHFFIINMTDFTKFSSYLTVDRPVGFVHLQKLRVGHGVYIRFKRLESLHLMWKDKHKRLYKKYKSFWVDFPLLSSEEWTEIDMNINGVEHASMDEYTRQKRLAISLIGRKKDNKKDLKSQLRWLKHRIATEPGCTLTQAERARHYKIDSRQFQRWASEYVDEDFDRKVEEGLVFEPGDGADIVKLREAGGEEEQVVKDGY